MGEIIVTEKTAVRGARGRAPALMPRAPALGLPPLSARSLVFVSRSIIILKNIYVAQKRQIKKFGL